MLLGRYKHRAERCYGTGKRRFFAPQHGKDDEPAEVADQLTCKMVQYDVLPQQISAIFEKIYLLSTPFFSSSRLMAS